jgi:hypothetical protein
MASKGELKVSGDHAQEFPFWLPRESVIVSILSIYRLLQVLLTEHSPISEHIKIG